MNFNFYRKISAFRRNVGWQFIGSAIQALLGGVFFLLIGSKLGASQFGVYSIIMGLVYTANQLFEPRIQDAAARQFWNFEMDSSSRKYQINSFIDLFAIEVVTKIVPLIFLLLLPSAVLSIMNLSSDNLETIAIAAIGFFFTKFGYGLSIGMLRIQGRSDLITLCTTGELIARLVLVCALIEFDKLSVFTCILLIGISGTLFTLIQWLIVIKLIGKISVEVLQWTPAQALHRQRCNQKLIFSNFGLSVTDVMNKDLDLLLISTSLSPSQVGVYKMAKNITMLAWRAIDPIYIAMMPEICRLVALKRWDEINRLLAKTSIGLSILTVTLCFTSFFLVYVFGDYFLGLTFTDVSGLMAYMLFGVVISAPLIWGHPLSVALNKPEIAFKGSAIASVVGLVAFAILVRTNGILGVGLAWAMSFMISFVFTALVSYTALRETLNINGKKS